LNEIEDILKPVQGGIKMPIYIQIATRAVASYAVLLLLTRIMGKREISQMTFFDYCVGITIGSITASMAVETSITWYNILPALVIFCLFQIIFSYISIKSRVFRKIVDGTPNILIKNGKVMEKNMLKSRINSDELISKLRQKDAFKLADVETAILETDGQISVQLKSYQQPVTPAVLNIQTPYIGLPKLIIEDGNILDKDLRYMKLSRAWLMSKLAEQGIYDYSHVMLAQVDASGNLFVDLYDDQNSKSNNNENSSFPEEL
jgi:uncharacterized membrane protein YcaP (DUF421 family)